MDRMVWHALLYPDTDEAKIEHIELQMGKNSNARDAMQMKMENTGERTGIN